MPKIKIDHVVSFSSEDPVHVANNILNPDPAKKWKCKEGGEISATVVLQLEKASVISGIDIGNENSAYIEVLASRSGTNEDYKVLLVMSSFMTPLEARQSTNINKVRMFTQEQLSKPECEQKWDRIKIVCTQPFNRHVQYGLSFVTFYTPGDKNGASPVQATIGKFTIRPSSPDDLSAGSLFARRKEGQKESLSAAAAIREASASPSFKPKLKVNNSSKNGDIQDTKAQPRNRNELLYSQDEEAPNEKIDKLIEKKLLEDKEKKAKEEFKKIAASSKEESKTEEEPKKIATPSKEDTKKVATPKFKGESSKRRSDSGESTPTKKIKIDKPVLKKPFNELLRGVTLVISGIQNPDRANLRSMALDMGAKYKPDWDDSCTHLICAFVNTPKFNQVKGRGKIVKRSWIEECHSQRKRLPWRRYCLDRNDSKKDESEDEIWAEIKIGRIKDDSSSSSTDEEGFDDTRMQKKIDELQAKQQKPKTEDAFSVDTDEETNQPVNSTDDIPNTLADFFDLKTFFIDETLDEEVTKPLERYIIAYNGIIAENPSDDVDYFITSEENADNFTIYSNASCVRPDWIWDCHNSQKLVSSSDYLL